MIIEVKVIRKLVYFIIISLSKRIILTLVMNMKIIILTILIIVLTIVAIVLIDNAVLDRIAAAITTTSAVIIISK